MLKKLIDKVEDLGYKQITSQHYFFLSFVVMMSIVLIYIGTATREGGDAPYAVSHGRTGTGVNDAVKMTTLQWMKDHSEMSEQVLSKIYSVAMNSVNADLVLAICLVESNFNPHVESEKGAIGLMGIMPDIWLDELKTHGIVRQQDDLYTISSNINSGIYVLGRYLARTNNLKEALIRYAGGDPAYAARVLRTLGEISRVRRSEDLPSFAAPRTET